MHFLFGKSLLAHSYAHNETHTKASLLGGVGVGGTVSGILSHCLLLGTDGSWPRGGCLQAGGAGRGAGLEGDGAASEELGTWDRNPHLGQDCTLQPSTFISPGLPALGEPGLWN